MSLYVDDTFELFDADESTFIVTYTSDEYAEIDIQHYTEEVSPSERAIGTLSISTSSNVASIIIRGSNLIFTNFNVAYNGEIVFRGRIDNTCNITTDSLSISGFSSEGLYLYPYTWHSVIFTQTSGTAWASNCILEGIQSSGGALFLSLVSNGCADYGGNDGWLFYETPIVETYDGTNLGVTGFTGQGEVISVGRPGTSGTSGTSGNVGKRGFICSIPSASILYETDCSTFDGWSISEYNPVQLPGEWLFEYIENVDSYPYMSMDEYLPISISNIFEIEITMNIMSLIETTSFWFYFYEQDDFNFEFYFTNTNLFLYQYDVGDYVNTEIPTPLDGEHTWKFIIDSMEGYQYTSCNVYIDNVFQSGYPIGAYGPHSVSGARFEIYGNYDSDPPPTSGFSVSVNNIQISNTLSNVSFYEEGIFGVETYSLPITGCQKLSNSYIQAFAENEYGIGYGRLVTVTLVSDEYIFTNIQGNHTIGVNFIYSGGGM